MEAKPQRPVACPALVPFLSRKSELKHRLTMIKKPKHQKRPLAQSAVICLAIVACATTFTSAVADEKKERKREQDRPVATKAAKSDKPARKDNSAERIKIPLDVFLNSRSAYISGKSLRLDDVVAMVRKFGEDGVILTVEDGVTQERKAEVLEAIRGAGTPSVKVRNYTPMSEIEKKRETVKKVQGRLEGHEGPLRVYVSNRGTWIKGTQLPAGVLSQLSRIYGKEGVILSVEPDTPHAKVQMIMEQVNEGGVRKIKLTTPPTADY